MSKLRRFALLAFAAYIASRVFGRRRKMKEGYEEAREMAEKKVA